MTTYYIIKHGIKKKNAQQPQDQDQRVEEKRREERNKPVRFKGTRPVSYMYKGRMGPVFLHLFLLLLSLTKQKQERRERSSPLSLLKPMNMRVEKMKLHLLRRDPSTPARWPLANRRRRRRAKKKRSRFRKKTSKVSSRPPLFKSTITFLKTCTKIPRSTKRHSTFF